MILIFGGTTEGRAAVKVASEAVHPYLYSTLGDTQTVATPGGEHLTGALDAAATKALCRDKGVRLIVDAAHPFADGVHRTIAEAAAACGIPVIRYERRAEPAEGVIWCDDWADAVALLEAAGVERLLALTGVRTIPKLRGFWTCNPTRFRILDRPASVAEAMGHGFQRENLLFYKEGESEIDVLRREAPDAVITKESGAAGGFPEKVAAARLLGIPLYALRRPAMPEGFHTVYTEAGLRRRIEELLPGYFPLRGRLNFATEGISGSDREIFSHGEGGVGVPTATEPGEKSTGSEPEIPSVANSKRPLRSGYTTGTCATAAACAALRGLLSGEAADEVAVVLPGGERVVLPVARMTTDGEATVIKDAGDDLDVTNGCEITVRVALTDRDAVRFLQGEGVGRVTLPGLGIEVGEPAVNPAPRKMIRDNFAALGVAGADVTISVKDGGALAQKTFNPRLGISSGISIIGTTGIVRPFSDEAFVESIEREIAVARAVGCRELVINSGAKSEATVRAEFPSLPSSAFVHYGNFIGETLRAAARAGFRRVAMGIMIGKAVKLADGHLDTHSRDASMDRGFLRSLAAEAACSPDAMQTIERAALARELWTELSPDDRELFMPALLAACHAHCAPLLPEGRLSMFLISEDGKVACRI